MYEQASLKRHESHLILHTTPKKEPCEYSRVNLLQYDCLTSCLRDVFELGHRHAQVGVRHPPGGSFDHVLPDDRDALPGRLGLDLTLETFCRHLLRKKCELACDTGGGGKGRP